MRTYVYVDGFNLYYGALKGSHYKWLDLKDSDQTGFLCRVPAPESDTRHHVPQTLCLVACNQETENRGQTPQN